jgi:hypothetical protein
MSSKPLVSLRRSERGFAIPIALAGMTVALALAFVAIATAIDTSSFTTRDTNTKAALAAADAGARVATFRLDQFNPAANNCPTQPTSAAVDGNGLCPVDGPEPLGNGATFQYWVSRAMVAGDTCVGPVVDSTQLYMVQRCVTAVGTVGSVSMRIQERVAQYVPTPVFPTAIFATKSLTISNNETIISDTAGQHALLGTNGTVSVGGTGGGTTTIDGYQLPPGASVTTGGNIVNTGPTTGRLTPYPIPTPINPDHTAQNTSAPYDNAATFQGGTCLAPSPKPANWIQTNCDYRILCPNVGSCDPATGSVSFDATARTLYLGNNATLVLAGGYYNFCSLYLSNNSQITIAPGAQAWIYIDSPGDKNACSTANSAQGVAPGTLTLVQNSSINAGGSALNAQIYVYGDPVNTPPNNAVTLTNNGSSSYSLVAPFSNINISPSNNTIFRGAIVGYAVTIGNSGHFTYEADVSSLQTGALQLYYRSFWEQCSGPGSISSPTPGC